MIAADLTIEDKETFLCLALQLSPENLFADGERSRTQAAALKRRIRAQWRELETSRGVKVSETMAYDFSQEIDAHHAAIRRAKVAVGPSHSLVETEDGGTWYRKGANGQTAYYIWAPIRYGRNTGKYEIYSEFSRMFGRQEKIGEFAATGFDQTGLDRAVKIGEDYLATINFESLQAARPLYRPENIKHALGRMPEGFDLKIPPMLQCSYRRRIDP